MDTLITVKDLHKSFVEQKVLDGIDFTVSHGETLVVLGRSGTGKSVLLKLLIGLEKPDSGSICIYGQDLNGLSIDALNEVRKKIGFLFQQGALYDSLTIGENVAFPLSRHTQLSADERKARVKELLSSVGLQVDLSKMPSEISGGMQKRVGLARALALKPEMVMFDKPTAGLDPITAEETAQLVIQLREQQQITSIVVTHDIHSARKIADRLIMIDRGRIVMEGTFEDFQKSQDPFVSLFLKDAA